VFQLRGRRSRYTNVDKNGRFPRGNSMDIYVGNLSYDISVEELRDAFEQHGDVANAKIISDRETGRSKGFGFIEMLDEEEAKAAITELNGAMLKGRTARVNEARPRN
jgi:RNA recognition motif-containing protein